jgi:hypothetical protein
MIQNKFDLKILNKLDHEVEVQVTAAGPDGLILVDAEKTLTLKSGKITSRIMFVKVPNNNLAESRVPLIFTIQNKDNPEDSVRYDSAFFSPRH